MLPGEGGKDGFHGSSKLSNTMPPPPPPPKENFESCNVIYCCHKKAMGPMDKYQILGQIFIFSSCDHQWGRSRLLFQSVKYKSEQIGPLLSFYTKTKGSSIDVYIHPIYILYLSDTFIEYLCNLIDYCTTKWRRQYYCTIYNKMRQRCLLAWIV